MNYELDTTVRERRSVRGFDPQKPVAEATLREVLELAQHAPSNCNVQPWRVFIASGESRDSLRSALLAAFDSGVRPPDDMPMDVFHDEYRKHQVACAVEMYTKMGVARDDKPGRIAAERRNFELFDAPQVAIICMHKNFGPGVALDVGMWVQTFMLLLWSRGIGSCAQASLRHYGQILRAELEIPEDLQPLCGVSFGYELADVPANATRQPRESIESNIFFRE